MTSEQFHIHLQAHAASFAKAVATNEGEWIIKGFIDVYQRVYSISVDTKIVSKVLELLLFPMFVEFATKHGLQIELCQHQNFYPDLPLPTPPLAIGSRWTSRAPAARANPK